MTSLNEDLARVAEVLRSVTDHDVEVVGTEVYVNFEYRAAVIVEPVVVPEGKRYYTAVWGWDQTGGVTDEIPLGSEGTGLLTFSDLPGVVKEWLDARDEQTRRLEELLGPE